MKTILKKIKVIQVKKVIVKNQLDGYETYEMCRANPYNPLSYIYLIYINLLVLVFYGVVGFLEEFKNPFKYQLL
jgi:hypothetical protein